MKMQFARTSLLSIATLALSVCLVEAQEEKWFDMESCALCECMKDHQDIMKDTKWSVHKTSNGAMMAHFIPEKHKEVMKQATEKMMAQVAKMEKGEVLPLCAFCTGYGGLKMAGANIEEFETAAGHVTLITSEDADLVKKIQQFVMKAKEEHDKIMKQMESEK